MEVIRGVENLGRTLSRAVLTIGNFDGVHLGHQRIIGRAVEKARERGGISVAYTFRPHPQVALRPASSLPLLTTYDEKLELMGKLGLDVVIEEPFSREFSVIAPEEFFRDFLLRRVSAESIVVGYDFSFGKERQGHLEKLEALCREAGVELEIVQAQRSGSEVVSSSAVRQHLLQGEVEAAARLLGRDFFYRGIVVKGEGRGRTIGFPTANLKLETKLTLPYGVYATHASVGGVSYPSVTNVGVRPTFRAPDGSELPALIETHLLDVTRDLYGTTLEVSFVKRLRAERKFAGIDALKAQIALDADEARAALS
jgi:riboflavin kinase/FMN adenylyltransferase